MSTVIIDREIIPNACRDSIGVRGACSGTPSFYLDSIGISLSKAAKLSDSATVTARQLIDDSIESAWGSVFSDLKVQGFKVPGVTKRFTKEFTTETVGAGTYTVELTRSCEFEQFWFNKVQFKVDGDLDLVASLSYGNTSTDLFNDSAGDETVTIFIDTAFPYETSTLTLTATGTGELYTVDGESPINYDGYLECSEKLFFCKYHNYLTQAVMYKAAALILNNSLFNDRYNDLIAYKKDEIAIRVSQLDSSLNLLNTENRINKYGLYQQEIDKINDKLKRIIDSGCHCGCCFECAEYISTKIVMP